MNNDPIYYARYCKVCGKVLGDKDRATGKHENCDDAQFCCYCGKSLHGIKWWYFNGSFATCSNDCISDNAKANMENKRVRWKKKYPDFGTQVIDWIIKFDEQGADDDDDYEDSEIQSRNGLYRAFNSKNYILLFQNSDGRVWYEKLEDDVSTDVLRYIIKSRHRKCIGMGCNEYVSHIIKDREEVNRQNWIDR